MGSHLPERIDPVDTPSSILVIEDNDAKAYTLCHSLRRAGYTVRHVATGEQGLALASSPVDLIVLDVQLPGISGLEVCRILKADPATARVPILQISEAFTDPEDQARGLDCGADGYLAGPVSAIVILATVRALLRASRAEDALRGAQRRYRSLFTNSFDAVFLATDDGRILAANPAACALFGMSERDLCRAGCRGIADTADPRWSAVFDQRRRRQNVRAELMYVRGDGSRFEGEASSVVLDDEGNDFIMIRDITARKTAEKGLRRDAERFRIMGEVLPYGVWWCNERGRVEYVSQSFLDLIEMTMDQVRESGWIRRLRREEVLPLLRRWLRCVRTGSDWEGEHEVLGPDGKYHAVLSRGRPVRDHDGRIIGWAGINFDLGHRKRLEVELAAARDSARAAQAQAERANAAKDQFLAVLSHELRTPLMPVVMTASILATRRDLPSDVQAELQTILRNTQLEARLIDDLLDLTRIARGKMQFDFRLVDAHRALRAAADICGQGDGAPIWLDLQATRHWLRGDLARLEQVFWNLLNNARKFTPGAGRITIRSRDDETAGLRIEVQDTGIGIDPAILNKVFNAFEQGDVAHARRGGLGLGLAISRAIILAHHGDIRAHSDGPGKGATFSIAFSAAAALPESQEPAQPVPAAHPGLPTRLVRILLVEDHDSTRAIMGKLIAGLGHHVHAAASVEAAKALAGSETFDLVISDLGLPDGTGHELMAWLRQRYGLAGIALSGYGMEDDVRRSREAGFIEHLTKPINLEQFQAALTRALARSPG